MWKNLSVRAKLAVCVVPLVLIIVLSALSSNISVQNLQTSSSEVQMYDQLELNFLRREIDHLQWTQKLLTYVSLRQQGKLDLQTNPTLCAFGKWYAGEERKQLEAAVPELAGIMRDIEAPHARLHQSAINISAAAEKNDWMQALTILQGESIPALNDVLQLLNTSMSTIAEAQAKVKAESVRKASQTVMLNWIAMVMGLLLAVVCITVLMRAILGPLGKLTNYTRAVQAGDSSAVLDIQRRDQFGVLADSLRALMAKLGNELAFSRSILMGLPLCVSLYDTQNKLTFANQRMLDFLELGGNPEDYYGKTSGDFLFREPDRKTAAYTCLETGESREVSTDVTTYGGDKRFVLTQAAPLFNDAGSMTGSLSVWTDTTEMHNKQMEIAGARDAMLRVAASAQEVAEKVAGTSDELHERIARASEGAARQRDAVQETATSINEMNAAVADITRNAADAATVSHDSMERAEHGEELVSRVVEAMRQLDSQSRAISTGMSSLRTHADGVGRVISVISDIADQTNLLALNAAIEAARAGEAGRGFAVVADSVRTLAEKTMQATREVVEVIEAIQNGAKSSADSVDKAVENINATVELAASSGEALREIVELSRAASDRVQNIASASTEQAASCDSISQSIQAASDVVGETAESMDGAALATEEMARQAAILKELVQELK